MKHLRIVAPAVAGIALLAGNAQAQLEAVQVGGTFASPVYVCSPPGDTSRLFVVEQAGRIKIVKDGVTLPGLFLDIDPMVLSGGERGLLGMAFHPDYAANRRFYVSYTDNSGSSIVRQYLRSVSNPDAADPSTGVTIFGPLSQPFSNHNGGCIQFGADGKLYLGLGDGGSANDPGNRAQNPTNLLGKMLRFDVDIPFPHIPADNPFVGDPTTDDRIWDLGVRNPWRFSFDRDTGDMWIGDVGQNAREEVDFEPAGSGGNNYGWRCMEGFNCTGLSGCTCNAPNLTLPVHDYSHAAGQCSITGGYRYRGAAMPAFFGRYFFADYCAGRVWSFAFNGTSISDLTDHTADLAIPGGELPVSFGEDANGELYMVDQNGGQVWRFQEECNAALTNFCVTSPNSNGQGAIIGGTNDTSVTNNAFTLTVTAASSSQPGVFYYGPDEIQVPFGNGFRCVGGAQVFRLPVTASDAFGDVSFALDLTAPPANSGPGMITAGSTWKFQYWYRDPVGGGAGFNLSDGLSASFCP